jgi:hypothetical protein
VAHQAEGGDEHDQEVKKLANPERQKWGDVIVVSGRM